MSVWTKVVDHPIVNANQWTMMLVCLKKMRFFSFSVRWIREITFSPCRLEDLHFNLCQGLFINLASALLTLTLKGYSLNWMMCLSLWRHYFLFSGSTPSRSAGFLGTSSPGPMADLYGTASQESAVSSYLSAASPAPSTGFSHSLGVSYCCHF